MEKYNLPKLLLKFLGPKDCGVFLDWRAYSIVCENNTGQYYLIYVYNHPFLCIYTVIRRYLTSLLRLQMIKA